jgi:acylphosphatase
MLAMVKRVTIELTGDVQDEVYRSYCKSIAEKFGITGYIKNISLRGAEIVAEGVEEKIAEFARLIQTDYVQRFLPENKKRSLRRKYKEFTLL